MRILKAMAVAVLAAVGLAPGVRAEVRLSGTFTAARSCPATPAIRRPGNPGAVTIDAGKTYPVLSKNAEAATHYRLRIEGAAPAERWVAADCGSFSGTVVHAGGGPAGSGGAARPNGLLLLAASWQPAFCETRPGKLECRTQTEQRPDARQFSLHGLWPQPRGVEYCGVSDADKRASKDGSWHKLPDPELSTPTRLRLGTVMPGTMSLLERHEWIKHGTCYGADAEAYFDESAGLMEALNRSAVARLFADRLGRTVTAAEVRAAFDAAFGPGAGERVRLACVDDGPRRLIGEITIGLSGRPTAGRSIGELIAGAPATTPGCPGGIVDRIGDQ